MPKLILPRKIRKRDGSVVPFEKEKIRYAVERAAFEVLQDRLKSITVSETVTDTVLADVDRLYRKTAPGVEAIQDLVEQGLMKAGYSPIARAYILYRERRAEMRQAKAALGLKDDLKFPINAMEVLKKRYLIKDDERNIVETPGELFRRVARHVARGEKGFKSAVSATEAEETFYDMMRELTFLPNSPTLMNAGTALGQLSACFVLPVGDSIDGIFGALHHMAKIHQSGGGTGFNFSHLRPKGDLVKTTKGEASGPVSFMSIFDAATGRHRPGGTPPGGQHGDFALRPPGHHGLYRGQDRQGSLCQLQPLHRRDGPLHGCRAPQRQLRPREPPDGEERPHGEGKDDLRPDRLRGLAHGRPGTHLRRRDQPAEPHAGPGAHRGYKPLRGASAAALRELQPGLREPRQDGERRQARLEASGRNDPLGGALPRRRHRGEQLPHARDTSKSRAETARSGWASWGLPTCSSASGSPTIRRMAERFARRLMAFIRRESLKASAALAAERGVFPNYDKSIFARKNLPVRNATVNTVAPTGTISIIAGCSSGIEPLFAISFVRNVLSGTRLFEINPIFEKVARARGIYKREILAEIARWGSLQKIKGIPRDIKRVFVTAFDVEPEQHLRIQAAFQEHCDNSVSKTINLPTESTIDEVRNIYLAAHKLKCKGITIYRYGSRAEQVLSFRGADGGPVILEEDLMAADSEFAGGCMTGTCTF